MKFQCVLCLSTYNVDSVQLGSSIECANCGKKIVVPKKSYDRGRVIGGDFVIDRILGTGGMGTVYLAKQISLEREVALKVLSRKFSVDQKFRMEFQREARAASRLTHTNLVQAYAFGEDEGDLFLAMEYVEGVTLGDRLDNETRIVIDEALNIVQQVAEGLHFAWTEEQLIHRDIKPDNIMLTPDGHVKLTDMGLARTAVELENVTEVSGTPAYMNPEQFTKQPMDCRADIYSLGVCLYHAVTGQLPFDSPNVRELARQHIQDKMEFPDKTVDLPQDLKKIIRKMMAKNREDRHNDHDDLLHDIYNTRLKINETDTHVPSVHTLSFNRYEFKNLRPQKKGKDGDTQVSSTKQLPRKKIKPLSSATASITSSFTTMDGEGKGNYFINNLLALAAIIVAVILVYMWGGDSKSQFHTDTQELISKIYNKELKTPEEIVNAADEILNRKAGSSPNKYDYAARNELLDLKLRYMKRDYADKLNELNELKSRFDKFKKESLINTAKEYTQKNEKLSKDIARLQKQLESARREFEKLSQSKTDNPGTDIKETSSQALEPTFSKAIADDMKALTILWEKQKETHMVEILRRHGVKNYNEAKNYIDKEAQIYSGKYYRWFRQQKQFVEKAERIWDYVIQNLALLKNQTVEIADGKEVEITKVYPQSAQIEYGDNLDFIFLKELEIKYFLKIYEKICEIDNTKPIEGTSFAVSSYNFNFAYEIARKDKKLVQEYTNAYILGLLANIRRMVKDGKVTTAEKYARTMYKNCSDVPGIQDLESEFELIFARDILADEDN